MVCGSDICCPHLQLNKYIQIDCFMSFGLYLPVIYKYRYTPKSVCYHVRWPYVTFKAKVLSFLINLIKLLLR